MKKRPKIGEVVVTGKDIREIIPHIWKKAIVIGYDGSRDDLVYVMHDQKKRLISSIAIEWLKDFNPSARE